MSVKNTGFFKERQIETPPDLVGTTLKVIKDLEQLLNKFKQLESYRQKTLGIKDPRLHAKRQSIEEHRQQIQQIYRAESLDEINNISQSASQSHRK